MRKRRLLSLLVLLMTAVTGAWASIGGTGSQDDPYTISSAADWNEFCASFDTKDYADKYVALTCNIPTADEVAAGTQAVTKMAAETYQGNYFKGTFDGGDYTITVNLGSGWEKYTCGLFRYLDGATIKNLKVDGTVCAYGWKWRGGFAGVTYGNCTFENCTSKVTINAGTYMNNHSSGGFVGCSRGNITFTNCVFQGQLSGAYATHWGGFVGQKDNDDYKVTLNKCLFAPTQVTASATGSATFVRTDDADGITIGSGDNGAYCTQFLGTQQGTLASTTEPTAGNGIYKSAKVNGQTCFVVATVSGIEEEYIADGKSHTLIPVLTCMGTQLSKDEDYTIADGSQLTYSGTGDYSVTFNAAGSTYKGSCTISYKVISPSGNCGENVTWSLDLSSGVMTISGTGAMADYSSLSEIPWYSNRNVITSIVIGEGVTTIGNGAFYQCNNLASVSVPASVTSIGEETFAECGPSTGMAVTIAEGSALGTIGAKAFLWSNLNSITIPSSVASIGKMAFYGCSKLATVTVYAEPTCTLENSAFNDCSNLEAIYVPGDKVNDFKAATGWIAYKDIIKAIPTVTIYCKMEYSWWTDANAAIGIYAWDDNGTPKAAWPGERMTLVDGETNVWKFDLDVNKYKYCNFTRVNPSGDIADWGAKTKDLTIPTDDKDMFTITTSEAAWDSESKTCDGTWSKYGLKFQIAGSMTNWEENIIYVCDDSYTFENLAAGNYKFKVVDNGSWKGYADLTEVAGGLYTDTDGNVCFELGEAGDVTVNYKSGELFTATGNFVAREVALAGSMNNWSTTANVLVPAEDKKTASVTVALTKQDYELKMVVEGSWLTNANGDESYELHRNWPSVPNVVSDGKNIVLKADVAGDYTFTWEYATNTLTVTFPTSLTLDEVDDNTATLAEWNGIEADVTLKRTLIGGMWNTITVPFNVDATKLAALKLMKGVIVKELSSASFDAGSLTLNFGDAESIVAGKPYLVMVSDDFDLSTTAFPNVEVSKTAVPFTSDYVDFIPTLGKTTIGSTGDNPNSILFLGANNTLMNPETMPTLMKGFRAYFQLKEGAIAARSFNLNIDGETTAVSDLKNNEQITNNNCYDLQGRRMEGQPTKKGVYIVNGKKVVIK